MLPLWHLHTCWVNLIDGLNIPPLAFTAFITDITLVLHLFLPPSHIVQQQTALWSAALCLCLLVMAPCPAILEINPRGGKKYGLELRQWRLQTISGFCLSTALWSTPEMLKPCLEAICFSGEKHLTSESTMASAKAFTDWAHSFSDAFM